MMSKQDIRKIWESTTEVYKNLVIDSVNDHDVHLAIFEGQYPWHSHPNSDELFLVLDGQLLIEFNDGESVSLLPFETYLVKAGRVHRTTAIGRTVNLCFEKRDAETTFI